MIRLGLSEAVAVYLFIAIGVLFVVWGMAFFRSRKSSDRLNATEFVRRCPYCGHVFLDYRKLELIVCPVCESYFEGGQDGTPNQ
jgi:ribosomal protein L32